VRGTFSIEYQGAKIDLAGDWRRVTMRDAIGARLGIDVLACADLAALREACRSRGVPAPEAPTWARLVDALFSEHVEPGLVQPTFVTDYPVELSPLAKRSREDPRLVERFEAFLAGMEIGNAFSELNDPDDQRERMLAGRRDQVDDDEAHPLDEDYLRALEVGLPPTGGLGVGVDRLAMILADAPSLREVIAFPHVRPRADAPAGDGDDEA
jgi:lysyl-tRNA synthetase class 2